MSEPTSGQTRYLIGGGAAACAVCCAPPVLALVGIAGAGTAATVATFAFAGLVFALVVALATIAAFILRKRRVTRHSHCEDHTMTIARSLILFVAAALAEIGGAWLIWQGVRENRGWVYVGLGVVALGVYGFVATLQPDANFGRILAAYGGVFVAGSLAWGMVVEGFRPDRYDVTGALVCLVGVAVIMYAPRDA